MLALDPGVALGTDVTFFVDTEEGTATEEEDFGRLLDAEVGFQAGETDGATAAVQLPILADALAEGDETLTLKLYARPSTAPGGHGSLLDTHTVTITDDDSD